MKQTLLFFSLFLLSLSVYSQTKTIQLYSFQESIGNYNTISGTGTLLSPDSWDDGCTAATDIGFNFVYNDLTFTQFSVNTNGTVNLGGNYIKTETNNLESETDTNILTPLWDDLLFPSSGSSDGIFYELDNSVADSFVLTIEFYQITRYNSTGNVNFQVKLFQKENKIEFIYDDLSSTTGWSEYSTSSIGFNARNNDQTIFLSVSPDNTSGATVSFETENDAISRQTLSEIQQGTTYSFKPIEPGTEPNIELLSIISPNSNFLTSHDTVKVKISNPGSDINTGLQLKLEVFDTLSGAQVGTTITEDFSDYPILFSDILVYTFNNTIDLSENKVYQIVVSLILAGDIEPQNNSLSKIVKGVKLDDLLYSNGEIITQTGVGFHGADISEVQTDLGMYNYGYNTNTIIGYRNADDFIIPDNETWIITGIGVYNWQTGSGTYPTIDYLDFRILDGSPNNNNTNAIVDYYDVNKISGTKWSNIYRVYDTDPENTERPIMYSVTSLEENEYITLQGGKYWFDYSSGGSSDNGPWVPFISILETTATGDAWHLGYSGWEDWIEDGTSAKQGMPFFLYGQKTVNINEDQTSSLKVFPNPTNGLFKINIDKTCKIEIYDICGKIILKQQYNPGETINIQNEVSGIYLLKVISDDIIQTKKLIIEK